MQYAIITTGGKQYKVATGDKISVEKLPGEVGSPFTFDQVLLCGENENLKLGTPFLTGAKVEAEILEQGRGEKIDVLKKKRRKGYRKKLGHRQAFTILKIKNILA